MGVHHDPLLLLLSPSTPVGIPKPGFAASPGEGCSEILQTKFASIHFGFLKRPRQTARRGGGGVAKPVQRNLGPTPRLGKRGAIGEKGGPWELSGRGLPPCGFLSTL